VAVDWNATVLAPATAGNPGAASHPEHMRNKEQGRRGLPAIHRRWRGADESRGHALVRRRVVMSHVGYCILDAPLGQCGIA